MYNLKTFEEKANSLTPDKIEVLNFEGVKKPVSFRCLRCGKISRVKKGEVLLRKGKTYQCSFCHYTKEKITKESELKLQKAAKKTNKELIYYTNASTAAKFKCLKCGNTFTREPNRFLKNQSCPICETHCRAPSLQYVKEALKFLDGYELVNEETYTNLSTPMLVRHKCGFIWPVKIGKLLNEYSHCPKCSKKKSSGERKIQEWLDKNKIFYLYQWRAEIKDHFLFFDFFLPQNNLAIEFQGEQHYRSVDWFGGSTSLQ